MNISNVLFRMKAERKRVRAFLSAVRDSVLKRLI